jgi:site-specific DNA recombinase
MKEASFHEHARHKAVGVWVRVSHEDQVKGESPEHHERRARFYAESKGWQVREVYRLEAVSGKSVMSLPETQRMLTDISRGHITGLIFSKIARLARNTKELLEFADIFRENDADLISLQESIDTSTPAGRLFYTMIGALAQWEREEIADRVAASVPVRAQLGKPIGGQAPFGYMWKDKKLVPDPKEAPVRKLLYELFAQHKRKKTVASLLNEAGYRTRNGSRFSDTTVERLLRDSTAKGLHRANYTKSLGDKKHWKLKPETEWVLTPVEPIISEELWQQCNQILDANRKTAPPARKAVHLFAGLAYCTCGGKMYVPSNTPKYICFKCRNKIPIVDLEGVFHEQLKKLTFSSDELVQYFTEADRVVKEKEELLATLEKEQQRIKADMDKIMRLYLDEKISGDGFAKQYRPQEERLKQLEDQIPELQGEIDFLRISSLSSDEVFAEAETLYTSWPQLEPQEKRKIIETITEKVTIGKDEVSINLCYLPSSSESVASGQRNLTDSWRRQA